VFKQVKTLVAAAALCLSAMVQAQAPLQVATVNYPLAYFAERIGAEQVDVLFMAPADEDPAFWQPTAVQVSAYQQADVILLNGADYAKWLKKVSLPRARLVDTGKAYREQLIHTHGPSHNHGPEGDHSHAGSAFTTWLDMQLALQQVDAITAVLVRKHADGAASFKANAAALKQDLLALDAELEQLGQQLVGKTFVASHPVYQYLSRRYQLDITELMWEPEMELGVKELSELGRVIQNKSAKWMIWEGVPSQQNQQTLAERGIQSLVYSPAGNRPDSGDWLTTMRSNIKALRSSL
jgi:zinc transport system substrate-binding protein